MTVWLKYVPILFDKKQRSPNPTVCKILIKSSKNE